MSNQAQNPKSKFQKKGYALIYTLLFIVLLLTTVITTWVTGMADIRMQRRNEYSAEAYQLAKIGIDEGWIKYQKLIGSTYPRPNDDTLTFPNNACASSNLIFFRTWPDRIAPPPTPTPTATFLSPAPSLVDTLIGVYDYKICTSGVTTIEGIGYYKGNKITLKAEVTHGSNEGYCDPLIGAFPTCDDIETIGTPKLNHDNDILTIYQTGPS